MAKGGKIILEENGVLTQEALLAYAEGRLPAADVPQFEKLLRADPFSQEALEGMKLAADSAKMRTAVAGINDRLRQRTNLKVHKTKTFRIHWSNYAYAAAVFGVLIGLGVVLVNFLNNKNSQQSLTAEVQPPAETSADTIALPAAIPVDTAAGSTLSVMPADSQLKTTTENLPVQNQPVAPLRADQAKEEVKPEPIAQRMSEVSKKKEVITPTAGAAAPPAVMSAPAAEKEQREERAKLAAADLADDKAAAPKTEMQQAKELFDAGEFDQALKKYNKVLDEQPGNVDALYFGGICNYIKGENKKAEKSFDKLMTTNSYADGAKWYKANLLIRKGKNEQAKELLRELSNSNSSYKDRAIRKFDEINK